MSTEPELKVRITTQGDPAAIRAAAEEMAAANDRAAEFGRTLEKLNNEQLLQLEERIRADIKATDELGKSSAALRDQLKQVYDTRTSAQDMARAAQSTTSLGKAASGAAGDLMQLKRSGEDATRVITGLSAASEGGVRGVAGLLQAGRGLVGLFRVIGGLLTGPIGLGLGAAAAGIAYLGRVAKANQTAIEKMFADSAQRAEELKASYEQLEKTAKKSLEQQVADVGKLADAYQRVLGLMDAAEARVAKENEAAKGLELARLARDEQRALSSARTPEEQEKIRKRFDAQRTGVEQRFEDTAAENQKLAAQVRIDNARQTIAAQQRMIDSATSDAATKRRAADDAIALSAQAIDQHGAGSAIARDALQRSQVAKRDSDLAEAARVKITDEASAAIAGAEAQIQTAQQSAKMVAVQQEAVALQREANALAKAGAKPLASTAGIESGIASTEARRKAIQDAIDRRPAMADNSDLIAQLEAANSEGASLNAKLLQVQQENARTSAENSRAQLAIAKQTQSAQARDKRAIENARSIGG